MHDNGDWGVEGSPDVVVAAAWCLLESDPDPKDNSRDPKPDSWAGSSAIRRVAAIGVRLMTDGPRRMSGDVVVPEVTEDVKGVAPESAA